MTRSSEAPARTGLGALFSPLTVGPMTVKNRLVMAPMERNYANRDGTATDRTIAHYEDRARGGVGWIDVEATYVDPVGAGHTYQLGLHDDRCIPGFRALAEAAHRHGAKIGVELHHAGRNTSRAITGEQPVAPSPVPCEEAGGDVPRELTIDEIEAVIGRYADAARRAAEAGFDVVELHSAHGYLPLAFLSARTNHRTDEYGGSLENRMRFGTRVIEAFRANVPERVAIGCRFVASEFLPDGLTVEETAEYGKALEAAGCDYLSVSGGVYEAFREIIPPMDMPAGWLLPYASRIRAGVSIPVIGVSRFTDPHDAARAIADDHVDLVALGRALLADPELPRKAQEGRLDDIVTCIGYNQACVTTIAGDRDVTCLVNPRVGREPGFSLAPTERPRRVVVIGGGPAGMEAARVAAVRGHEVSLHEREEQLGGQARLAGLLPHRRGWRIYTEQAERRLRRSGATVELGREIGVADLAGLGADAVIVATGARYARPAIPGAADGRVLDPLTALSADEIPGERLLVSGAGAVGLGLAEWAAERGARVTVVAPEEEIEDPDGQAGLLARLAEGGRVVLRPGRTLVALAGEDAVLGIAGMTGPLDEEVVRGVDAVVAADGPRPHSGLAWAAEEAAVDGEIHVIGDCELPGTALAAVHGGTLLARRL